MPIAAGSMNQQVQFLRRTAGTYQPLGPVQWARLQFERANTINSAGVPLQGRSGRLTVRSCDLTRGLTVGDRLRMEGDEFAITIRKAEEIATDDVHLEIESAPTPALYAAEFDRRGDMVTLQRKLDAGAYARADVRAIVKGFQPNELVGDLDQGDRQVWILAADAVAAGWPVPPVKGDKIKVRGNALVVQSVDADSHREGGVLNAYYIIARGEQGV
ncbi:hypothetical protein [Methylobacterium longum]|uniref:Uncharacterized protein n=1 Tax=Methylobacterium longum TaxID=767694 RepID=A0ABT8AQH6_9HYPH|nr:hypothetical protein [Methylobacterium longum]MDN3571811.1 hypothetical protein [Methylobacterium longum]GJE14012.1 hypothetical protein FOHLNKBM_5081 [Methylobacterium longum]